MAYLSCPGDVTPLAKEITAVQLMLISTVKGAIVLLYHRQLTDCRGFGSLQMPVAVKIMNIIISVRQL